ncbi:deaminase, partial [Serratia marcescens]|nr:deaminase [Serratia marcescens]
MENPQQPGRRAFLSQTGKLTTACAVIGLTGGMAQAASPGDGQCAPAPMTLTDRHYCLSEVRLEDGFEYDGETVIGTRTALYTLEIKDGKIAAIHAANASLPAGVPRYQAQGQLLLPAFRDMHIHLDKTFYSGPWQAPRPRQGKTIMDMIALEQT